MLQYSRERLDSLQAIRAFAAIVVVCYHTAIVFDTVSAVTPWGDFFLNGDKGVDLFFVLSGFIIVFIHRKDVGHPHRFLPYCFSRVTRIYPLMWILSAAAIVVYVRGMHHAKDDKLGLLPLVQSIFLLPQNEPALVNVTWTLKYEIFFYLLFGLALVNRALGVIAIGLWQAAVLACIVWGADTSSLWAFYCRPIALEFGIGIAVALAFHQSTTWSPRLMAHTGRVSLVAGIASFAVFFLAYRGIYREFTFGLSSGLIIFGCGLLERARPLGTSRILVLLGDASYAIYLVNFSALTLMATYLARTHVAAISASTLLIAALLAIGAGILLYLAVDKPIARRAKRAGSTLFPTRVFR